MTRLDKLVFTIVRASIGAAAALVLLAACSQAQPANATASDGEIETVGQSYNTDFDVVYEEFADA